MKRRIRHLIMDAILDIIIMFMFVIWFAGLALYFGFIFDEPIMGIAVGTIATFGGAIAAVNEVEEYVDIINEIKSKEA